MPPPGSYEVAQSYQESQHKKDAANPRTTNARQKQGAFKSSASRFAPVRDIVVDKPEVENPGKKNENGKLCISPAQHMPLPPFPIPPRA